MNDSAVITVMLLVLLAIPLGMGAVMIFFVNHYKSRKTRRPAKEAEFYPSCRICAERRPDCWLAVKGADVNAVQGALDLHNAQPCSWVQGLAGEAKLFIAPPVRGWILVIGPGLPDPSEDADACFRFVMELSRRLGEAQFFSASPVLGRHSWVKAEGGRIVRAYAWADQTLWNQGERTSAEQDLDLRCFDYGEAPITGTFGRSELVGENVEKVPLLAARWSLDPGALEDRFFEAVRGVAGEPARRI